MSSELLFRCNPGTSLVPCASVEVDIKSMIPANQNKKETNKQKEARGSQKRNEKN